MREVDHLMLSSGGCRVIEQPWDTTPGVGKHSLRLGTARGASGVPKPVTRPGQFGSQALGHPGATGSCGRAENGEGTCGLHLAQDRGGGKRGAPAGSGGENP